MYVCEKLVMDSMLGFPILVQLIVGSLRFVFIFGGAFFLLWYYLKHTRKTEPVQQAPDARHMLMPLRLQAFERFVLFLERVHPTNLIMRLNSPELSAKQLQSLVARTIREEFEYNLSQQLYISVPLWEMIRNAKEETIAMVNQAASELADEATAADLVKKIFSLTIEKGKLPVEEALDEIKLELQRNIS